MNWMFHGLWLMAQGSWLAHMFHKFQDFSFSIYTIIFLKMLWVTSCILKRMSAINKGSEVPDFVDI